MYIGLSELAKQLPVSRKSVLKLYLHRAAREGAIPARCLAQRNHKVVDVHHRTLDLLAGRQRHYRCGVPAIGIEHMSFEFDGRVLSCDFVQIAGRGMTFAAAPYTI